MLDLADTYNSLSWLVPSLGKGCNIGHVHPEDVDVGILDLFEAFQAWEEGAPKHCTLESAWT